MHSIVGNNLVISTQEPVYRDSPLGKLERTSLVRTMFVPLQKGFDGNSKACFPIAIDYLPTFLAFKQGIVAGMPFANSTAVAAPFACMVGINNFKRNLLVKASAVKQLFKRIERNTHNLLVKSLSFWRKTFEVFNSNICIKIQSHFSNVSNNFSKPVFNKVMFPCLGFFKLLSRPMVPSVSKRLQPFLSFKNLFSLNPNVFSKIGLLQNLAFRGKDRDSKTLAVNVHSKNVPSLRQFRPLFGKISNYFKLWSESKCFALPSIRNKRGISLKVPVFLNGNWQSFSRIHSKPNKEAGFGFKDFAVSRNIEFDCNGFEGSAFFSPQVSNEGASDLNVEGGFFFAC